MSEREAVACEKCGRTEVVMNCGNCGAPECCPWCCLVATIEDTQDRLRTTIPRDRVEALVEEAYREGYEAGHLVDPDEKWLRIAWEESNARAALDALEEK
jgi:hypothetical protein